MRRHGSANVTVSHWPERQGNRSSKFYDAQHIL